MSIHQSIHWVLEVLWRSCGGLPGQLPQGEEDAELVVELLKLVKGAKDELRLLVTFSEEPDHVRLRGNITSSPQLRSCCNSSGGEGFTTHVVLVGAVSLLERKDGGAGDAAVLPEGVGLWGEGQNRFVAGWQPREPQLGQVVDEEVELGGHAAQTGLDQPAGGARETD